MCSLHVRLRKEITPDSKRSSVYARNKCKTSIVYVPGRDSRAKEKMWDVLNSMPQGARVFLSAQFNSVLNH